MATLTVDQVVGRALTMTDATDPDPTHFMGNLNAVIDAINNEAALNETGIQGVASQLAVALRNRIEVDRYIADHREIETAPVPSPIFLTGLPRSGTTYFQYLFDQDPRVRMLRTWEGDRPVPPPAVDAESVTRRRAASTEQARLAREATGGKIDAMHLTDVDGPQECLAILDQTFFNPGLLWMMSVGGYLDYLLHHADLQAAYAHHARVLQLLQWGGPSRRWTLKWPCHLLALDSIANVYPDARFVVTHRDPIQALASNCSLTYMLRTGTSPHADAVRIGRDMLELVRQHVDRLMAFENAQAQAARSMVVHVDYYRLVDSPETVMPEVFSAVNLEWTPAVDQEVRAWRAANPKGNRGTHEYRLDDYGLDRAGLAEIFRPYTERFDIQSEETLTI
jgi:sulfotransferase family protein